MNGQRPFWIAATLYLLLVAASVSAANARTILPVTVAPLNASGSLTPNTAYGYHFVFAASPACTPLLNVSANITTNARGIGTTDLNISGLSTTPAYVCEYVNGALRKAHPVFSSMFEQRTNATDMLGFGFNYTSQLDAYFLRTGLLSSCAAGQYSRWNGTHLVCAADQAGNATGGTAGVSSVQATDTFLIAMNGTTANFSANLSAFDARYYLASNPNGYVTLAQASAGLGNWSGDKAGYNTTVQLNALYLGIAATAANSEQLAGQASAYYWNATAALITMAQALAGLGNYSAAKTEYSVCAVGNYSAWNGSTFICAQDQGATAGADGTGGWTNASGVTSTSLVVNTSASMYSYNDVPMKTLQTYFCDFMTAYATTMCYPNFVGVVVGTGGISAAVASTARTPGLVSISKGTTAGSGYTWRSDVNSLLINGSEKFAAQLQVQTPAAGNTTVVRLGFHDQTTNAVADAVVDGVYFTIIGSPTGVNVSGAVASNSARKYTSVNYTGLAYGNQHTYFIAVSPDASSATFIIKDNTSAVVYNQTISGGGLPTGAGRNCGVDFIMGSTVASPAAAIVGYLDYLYAEVGVSRRPSIS